MKFSACIVAAFAAIAAAYTPPDTSKPPSGNPISRPGLLELVPVGQPYTITWQPSTPGKVSLLLLRGPSNNVKYLDTIADSVSNTGTYIWTPPTSLEGDESGYGIQIVVEGTGQYQYSTQFGIKNDKHVPEPSDIYPTNKYPTAKPTDNYPTAKPSDYPTGSSSSSSYTLVPISTATITVCASTVTACPQTKTPVTPSGTGPATVQPTVQPTYTASPKPTTPPPFDGAAGRNGVAIGGLVAAAVVMFAL
ncbi:GPI anchored serine-threonine rich protein [Paracoccidioides lutzii Pb01]|uniref:GPI anchored serine-threonine rich protein n=1 Tax=Paracoccidioides lutzii (strain ATCC MYA-826 / Pb01) TaxID=502779 RepID=C1H4S8_PARBA|nr:GPI anchored serine-threonine rich protein [Paracoccidioides lutzii Pb01]EEH34722.1 GPI anchored serine-threonine rich protein [Paracoccidioides lutzii Pb01]